MPIIYFGQTYPHVSVSSSLFSHHFPSRLSMFFRKNKNKKASPLSAASIFVGSHDLPEHGSISGATLLRKTICSGSHHPVAPSLGWASWVPPFLLLGVWVDLVQQLIWLLSQLLLLTCWWHPPPLPLKLLCPSSAAWLSLGGGTSINMFTTILLSVCLPVLLSRCFAERRLFKDTVSFIHLCTHSWGFRKNRHSLAISCVRMNWNRLYHWKVNGFPSILAYCLCLLLLFVCCFWDEVLFRILDWLVFASDFRVLGLQSCATVLGHSVCPVCHHYPLLAKTAVIFSLLA